MDELRTAAIFFEGKICVDTEGKQYRFNRIEDGCLVFEPLMHEETTRTRTLALDKVYQTMHLKELD